MIPLKLLVVEDSADDYELLLLTLREGGFAPMARRVETAGELAASVREQEWQFVISDYSLPGFDGISALRIVRGTGQDVPFLIVSGAIDEEQAVAAMRAGAQDYVFKGNLARLTPAVQRELAEAERRRHARQEVQAAREREQELNRLKSGFVSMVSHEFRTPLGVIRTAADLLERYGTKMDPQAWRERTTEIRTAVDRMVELMEGVLLHDSLDAGKTECRAEEFDLHACCERCRHEVTVSIHGRNPIRPVAGNVPERVMMDANLVRIIVTNLLANALKYSREGGEIDFEIGYGADGQSRIEAGPGTVMLRVRDRGIGIPTADLPKLYDSFHRGANVGNIAGNGLGLAIVKRCVTLHRGKIEVATELNAGTCFTVWLPELRRPESALSAGVEAGTSKL